MSHWYNKQGESTYTIIGSNGKERATTLRDARKLSLLPSVTTILGILDKAGLLRYFLQKIIGAAFSEERQKEGETFEEYVDRLHFAAKKDGEEAARKGSHLHDCLEKTFKGEKCLSDFTKEERGFIKPVIREVDLILPTTNDFGDQINWVAEDSFAHEAGFGGKVDLHSLTQQTNGKKGYVVDFKTKNTSDKKKFYKYNEHLMQLAAYRHGLGIPEARCFDLYFSSTTPGVVELHEWSEEELTTGYKQFICLLNYWQLSTKYDSSFIKERLIT